MLAKLTALFLVGRVGFEVANIKKSKNTTS